LRGGKGVLVKFDENEATEGGRGVCEGGNSVFFLCFLMGITWMPGLKITLR
jgi:hypothetical protein